MLAPSRIRSRTQLTNLLVLRVKSSYQLLEYYMNTYAQLAVNGCSYHDNRVSCSLYAVATYPCLGPLVNNLYRWFQDWHAGIEANPPLFGNPLNNNPPAVREHVINTVQERIKRLVNIVLIRLRRAEGLSSPGYLCPNGSWHNNDFELEDICEIRIAPTFLPANFYSALILLLQAVCDASSAIQALRRGYGEELTWAPLRQAIHEVHNDLKSKSLKRTKLGDLFDKEGGSISTSLLVDTPPCQGGAERSSQQATFREIHLGIIASPTQDLSDYVKQDKEHVKL
ncbi:hypothetical protein BYT27DRAFT_7249640 [Phlegmacium glaucopus]|nr:hypothetical protein BYT27DRAFT_7255436 [Phlegmacium glaucopus]KAF8814897.1 hypothetical protein BYT27DRAFT_7249640 [Phlegmacium glaucopus]